jgi:hypothetical protein
MSYTRPYYRSRLRRYAVTALILALLVGTTTAFALTQALKLERSPITRARLDHVFSPTCGCRRSTAHLAFRLRSADTLDLVIVDADGAPVRTLAAAAQHARGLVSVRWDGRDDNGALVPDGAYRLRVHLADDRRTIVVPTRMRVDTQAPEVELVSVAPRRLSPDGDGIRDTAAIVFRSDERARPLVLVDGVRAFAGRRTGPGSGTLVWDGTAQGKPLPAERYLVSLEARDRAGNVSTLTADVGVRVRYIEVAPSRLRGRPGDSVPFRVRTDAQRFDGKLFRRSRPGRSVSLLGPAEPGAALLRLPPNIRPGRYVLRVEANGHRDDALVIVRARR